MGMTRFAAALPLLLFLSPAWALERKPIVFSLPAGARSAWVEGSVSFAPGGLKDPGKFRVVDKEKREVPALVTASSRWFDGSVMLLGVGFKAGKPQERTLWLEWGDEVKKPPRLLKGEGDGKKAMFRIFETGGDLKVRGSMDVGTLVVRVEQHADLYYYWYLIPVLGILGWLTWRKYKIRRRAS